MKPIIIVNFKTYPESIGDKSLILARKIAKIKRNNYELAVAPSLLTVKEICKRTKLTVFSQHTDHILLGAHTGRVPAQELKKIGVKGTLLNHSERKIPLKYLENIVEICKKQKLKTIICAATLSEVKKVAKLQPTYLAYEPQELIGGDISVTESKPDVVVDAVELVKEISPKTKVLCGAGIHSKEDVGQALLLGCQGILLSSAIVKSNDPQKTLGKMLL